MKTAFITGATGQDGAYLAAFLLGAGYRIIGGVHRRSSSKSTNLHRLRIASDVEITNLDLRDPIEIRTQIAKFKPDEIYNFAAQSSVATSFADPASVAQVGAVGVANVLQAVIAENSKVRLFQASSSEMFGDNGVLFQNEITPFNPQSPYAMAKQFSHQLSVSYRKNYGLHVSCGIMFNHESPLRPPAYVTRKITTALAQIRKGKRDVLFLGDIDVVRDWGFAGDYVEGAWKILQQNLPDDYVLATGIGTSLRTFVEIAAAHFGYDLEWHGSGVDEIGADKKSGSVIVKIDPLLRRPAEVRRLVGDATKARQVLAWEPKKKIDQTIALMATADELLVT